MSATSTHDKVTLTAKGSDGSAHLALWKSSMTGEQ